MMRTPKEYLLASTIACLFSSAAIIHGAVGFEAWYVLMAVNFLLFAWLGAVRVRPGMFVLAAALLASGAVGYLQHTDTTALFAKQFLGITLSALYFSSYYHLAGDDPVRCFRHYVRAAYYVSIVGILRMAVEWCIEGKFPRLQSVLAEPSMFALVTLPAAYYCCERYRTHRTWGKELAVLVAALLLSQSSVGFLGILFGLGLFFSRSLPRALAGIAVAAVAGVVLYSASAAFRLRVDDTLHAAEEVNVEDTNLSTFALVSNAFVTSQVMAEHPIAGNGLGSHLLSHDAYIADVPGIASFENMMLSGQTTMDHLNAADANSLLLRLLSETGIAGVLAVLLFIGRYKAPRGGERAAINHAILIYFFAKLLRAGHYFNPEEFFFVFAYCLTGPSVRRSPSPSHAIAAPLEASV
jgi:hypothetical protein